MQLSFQRTYRFALNSSSSKSQHLFPKAERFFEPRRKEQRGKFYTLPTTIRYQQQKAPSFPKLVKKMQFPEQKSKRIIPSPSTYSIKSDIEKSLSKKRAISIPRQKLGKKFHDSTPGPGEYNPRKQPYLTARYSIGSSKKKLEFPVELQKGKQSPGPAYLVNVDKLQKVVSKYVNKKCLNVYSEPSLKKPRNTSIVNPEARVVLQSITKKSLDSKKLILFDRGPKTKPAVSNFSNLFDTTNNQSLIIKNEASIMRKFNKAERKSIFQTKASTPGPAYDWFSQFSRLEKKSITKKSSAKSLNTKITSNEDLIKSFQQQKYCKNHFLFLFIFSYFSK